MGQIVPVIRVQNPQSNPAAEWFVDYDLPARNIAQHAVEPRDAAGLLVLDGDGKTLHHQKIWDLPTWLVPGDLLVFNDTKVLPARLLGTREGTGGAFEMLFVRQAGDGNWEVMAQTGGKPGPGSRFLAKAPQMGTPRNRPEDSLLALTLIGRTEKRRWLVRPETDGDFADLLNRFGHLPLPPYIRAGREEPGDRKRYQTLFAGPPGSVAAPTAGLHFTQDLLDRLGQKGVELARVTLHVGPGTFQTIKGDPSTHEVESEWGEVSKEVAQKISDCQQKGGRIIAVGTTTTRVLESASRNWGTTIGPWQGEADLTIRPGYAFRVIQGLVTNFHLPRSSLLLLTQALTGSQRLAFAYGEAVRLGYRFYSYGDAMLILPRK